MRLVRFTALLVIGLFSVSLSNPISPNHASAKAAAAPVTALNLLLPDDPEATFEGARVVHNVTVKGQKGMRVHAKFRVKYGLDVACMMVAYFFYDDSDNTPLKSADKGYMTDKGNVSAKVNFTPAYDPAVYNDLQLFVPYSALNMEEGDDYDLKFYLALYDKEGERFFGKSTWYKFHLTVPGE
jgi:hypothetical protein